MLCSVAGARTDRDVWYPVSTLPAGGRMLGKLPAFVSSLGVLCQGVVGRPQGVPYSKEPVNGSLKQAGLARLQALSLTPI